MSDATLGSLIGGVSALIAAFLAYIGGRSRGRADAAKTGAEASTLASTDNRAWAELFRQHSATVAAELDRERGERRKEEDAHTVTRERLAAAEREIAVLKRDYAELAREVRRLGGHVPGETPAHGTATGPHGETIGGAS